jgi:hypothetical protein
MPKISLSRMTVEALMDLQKRVDETLHGSRAELEKQLETIAVVGGARIVRSGRSALREEKSRRNIVVHQVKLGQVVAQNLVGLLLRPKVERSLTIS